MPLRTGVGLTTHEEYMIGPGAVYYDWTNAGSPGTLLGETRVGNVFEVIPTFHETEPDGAMGHIKNHTRISRVDIRLTANLLGVTVANILRTLAGSQADNYELITVRGEWGILGTTAANEDSFIPEGADAIFFDTLNVYEDSGTNVPLLLTLNTHYAVEESTGTVTGIASGWDSDSNITCGYDYNAGGGNTLAVITMDQIAAANFLSNIAIVGEISDGDKTLDAVLVLKNALCMNGLTLTLPGGSEGETVMTAIFEGHFAANALNLADAPFQIVYDLA